MAQGVLTFAATAILEQLLYRLWRKFDTVFAQDRLQALRGSFLTFFYGFSNESFPGRFSDFGSCLEHFSDSFDGDGDPDDERPAELSYSESIYS